MDNKKVWFITGASKGLGLFLVKQLLRDGSAVAATSRQIDDLRQAVGSAHDFLPLAVDLKTETSVRQAIEQTIAHFGRIDVVVNNAGYGQVGSLEELSDEEARANFDVNVFGALNVIRNVMPQLRKQQSGYIINFSSVAGLVGSFPGFGIYCATKFAVEGFTEALAAEVRAFGIRVTSVAPGYFRTEFLSSGSLGTPSQPIDAYQSVRESQQVHQSQINGNQPGDPQKAIAVLIQLADEPSPPLHLLLGQDAYDLASDKLTTFRQEVETWKAVTLSTGFAEPPVTENTR